MAYSGAVGFVGLGGMGGGLVKNLLAHGVSVSVLDRRAEVVASAVGRGARAAKSMSDLACSCDVLMVCVNTADDSESLILGVLEHLDKGKIVVEHTTTNPDSITRLDAAVRATGAEFAEAPMTRTPLHADRGEVNVLYGGSAQLLERLRPLFDCYAENVFHVGPLTHAIMSAKEIEVFRGLRAATPAKPGLERVMQAIRDMLAERHRSYLRSGLKGVDSYARARGRLQSPAEDLRLSATTAEHLKAFEPTLHETLSRYHTEGLRDVRGTFLWSIASIEERRGLVLEHRLESVAEDVHVSFQRAYYVSHSMDAMQAVVGLRETVEGTLFVYVSQLWTEQVTGVGSSLKRSLGRRHLTRAMTRIVGSLGICDNPGAATTGPGGR